MKRIRHALARITVALLFLLLGLQATAQQPVRQRLSGSPPNYPSILRESGIGGVVNIEVVVTPAGTVKKASLIGGNPVLGEAAVQAIKQWKYAAAAAESTFVVELRFNPTSKDVR